VSFQNPEVALSVMAQKNMISPETLWWLRAESLMYYYGLKLKEIEEMDTEKLDILSEMLLMRLKEKPEPNVKTIRREL